MTRGKLTCANHFFHFCLLRSRNCIYTLSIEYFFHLIVNLFLRRMRSPPILTACQLITIYLSIRFLLSLRVFLGKYVQRKASNAHHRRLGVERVFFLHSENVSRSCKKKTDFYLFLFNLWMSTNISNWSYFVLLRFPERIGLNFTFHLLF